MRIKTTGWWLSFALAASLFIFGLIGLALPRLGAHIYGLPSEDSQLAIMYHAKAMRDLVMACLLMGATLTYSRTLMFYINTLGIAISLMDASVVMRLNPFANWQVFLLHGGTVVALIVTSLFLKYERVAVSRRIMIEEQVLST